MDRSANVGERVDLRADRRDQSRDTMHAVDRRDRCLFVNNERGADTFALSHDLAEDACHDGTFRLERVKFSTEIVDGRSKPIVLHGYASVPVFGNRSTYCVSASSSRPRIIAASC